MKQLWIMLTNQVMTSGNVFLATRPPNKAFKLSSVPRSCQFTLTSPLSSHYRWKLTVTKSLPTWAQRRPPRWHPPAGVWPRPEPSASAGLQSYSESSFCSWWTPTPSVRCHQTHGQTGKRRSYNQLTPEAIVKKSLTTKWDVSESKCAANRIKQSNKKAQQYYSSVSDILLTMKSDAQAVIFNVAEI